jgi:hypothetical protein
VQAAATLAVFLLFIRKLRRNVKAAKVCQLATLYVVGRHELLGRTVAKALVSDNREVI